MEEKKEREELTKLRESKTKMQENWRDEDLRAIKSSPPTTINELKP